MYIPTHLHSFYSTLDGLSDPNNIAKQCSEFGMPAVAHTDHGNTYGVIAMKEACQKYGLKSIHGVELYISKEPGNIKTPQNRSLTHLPILAKNKEGWEQLVKLISRTNENFYHRPRISLDELKSFGGNFWGLSGHAGSTITQSIWTSNDVYRATADNVSNFLNPNWKEDLAKNIKQHIEIFGQNNFFLEIQLIDQDNIPAVKTLSQILRWAGKEYGVPLLATADSHYTTKQDAPLQRVLLCSALRTTLNQVQYKMDNNEEFGLSAFFRSDNYHIPSPEEMVALHTPEELENSLRIAEETQDYSLGGTPNLPRFSCPNGLSEDSYLEQLCKSNFHKCPGGDIYHDRLQMELEVLKKNNLSGYFLIVQDYMKWTKSKGVICGPGRGSAAGCLVSYLLDITEVDPIKYDLVFERFYNEGRNQPGRIALPDIDSDFPKEFREEVISYLRRKYGDECVSHIITLSTLQGRGALKEVLRVYDACSHDEMNQITKNIPQEAEISDELQTMKETTGSASIIRWALENEPKDLEQWCRLKDDGTLEGDYAEYFDIAIKLEGVKKNESKHASGIIIANSPLKDIVPMINKKGEMLVGMEMEDLEKMGLVKFDILGLKSLSAIQEMVEFING